MGEVVQFGRPVIAGPQTFPPLSALRCDDKSEGLVNTAERSVDISTALTLASTFATCANQAFYERRNLNAFSLHLRAAKAAIERAEQLYECMQRSASTTAP